MKRRIRIQPAKVMRRAPSESLGARQHGEQVDEDDQRNRGAGEQVEGQIRAPLEAAFLHSEAVSARGELRCGGVKSA